MDFCLKSKIRFELIKTNSKYLTKYKAEFLVSRLDVPSDEQDTSLCYFYFIFIAVYVQSPTFFEVYYMQPKSL
jgi:hypothetical protein